jgi:hypothetical protein
MNKSEHSDYANASAFVRRIHTIDAQIGRDNRIAAGFALGEQLKSTPMVRHDSAHSHYALPMVVKHCEDCTP